MAATSRTRRIKKANDVEAEIPDPTVDLRLNMETALWVILEDGKPLKDFN